jgi:hypothetical protein
MWQEEAVVASLLPSPLEISMSKTLRYSISSLDNFSVSNVVIYCIIGFLFISISKGQSHEKMIFMIWDVSFA